MKFCHFEEKLRELRRGSMQKKNSTRIDFIDLLRFVFIFIVAAFHFVLIFKHDQNSHLRSAYMLVEFFFMLTGYLTARHFAKKRPKNSEEVAKNALSYTFSKFSSYLPYIIIALVFGLLWVLLSRRFNFVTLIADISKVPVELLLNSVFINEANIHVGPLWFLSAMFIVFPVFCMIAQIKKHRAFRNIFCLLFVLIFLGFGEFSVASIFGVFRAFSGLLMGLLMYDFIDSTRKKNLSRVSLFLIYLSIVASFSYIITIFVQRGDIAGMYPQIAYCLILAQFIILASIVSERTVFSNIKCKLFSLLGKISLPMFLVHESIAKILYRLDLGLNYQLSFLLYIAIVIIVSSLSYIVVNSLKKSPESRLSKRK